MTDAYLLDESVRRMTVLGVVEALSIAAQYGMCQLSRKYEEELVRRLTNDTFLQVGAGDGAPCNSLTAFLSSMRLPDRSSKRAWVSTACRHSLRLRQLRRVSPWPPLEGQSPLCRRVGHRGHTCTRRCTVCAI